MPENNPHHLHPFYDFDKIKFATNAPTFERAVALYEAEKIQDFQENSGDFSATVLGTQLYRVHVSTRHYDHGSCTCYVGQKNELCKHMVAVALHAVLQGRKLREEEKRQRTEPTCSCKMGILNGTRTAETKASITTALRFIKPYNGPSRIWFSYQNSLTEGCNRLASIISDLPVGEKTVTLLVDLLLRLDKKLCTGGVDDSDGTVGGFIQSVVAVLEEYAKHDPGCIRPFKKLLGRETCFDWEVPLIKMLEGKTRSTQQRGRPPGICAS